MADIIPPEVKKGLEKHCKKAAKKISKVAPGEKNEKKLEKLIVDEICSEVKNLDKKILKIAAEQLAKLGKSKSAKPPKGGIPKVDGKVTFKAPGSCVPSIEFPIAPSILLDPKLGTNLKFSVKIWADPKAFEKTDKGVMLNITVAKW